MLKFGKIEWKDAARGEERCFLLTNGLGGYCSFAITGANTREDHALLMGVLKAPNFRYHYITNVQERLQVNGQNYDLTTQSYGTWTRNQEGFQYLQMFSLKDFPEWVFQAGGVTVRKQIVMAHEENTVGIRYRIQAPEGIQGKLLVKPLLKFAVKGSQPKAEQSFDVSNERIESDGKKLYFACNGEVQIQKEAWIRDLYFSYDARDGRDCIGTAVTNHEIVYEICGGRQEFTLLYSDRPIQKTVTELMEEEVLRLRKLDETAGFRNPAAVRLARSADQFLVKRDSTGKDTIIAGYPFFGDWGRDTMIALFGCAVSTGQYNRARSILETFSSYCQKGLMPNLFPEGEDEPMYNTADASLWFVEAVYEYGKASGDMAFVEKQLPVMQEIIRWYRNGTDFHIFMDSDGLISAGADLEQVTWMDVRIGEILPTPRHGKPVEINALWYNALCILAELTTDTAEAQEYRELAGKTKESFREKFWMEEKGCLKDVLSLEEEHRTADTNIRCNQVWALSLPYSMVTEEQAQKVLSVIEQELYTPYGLRSLAPMDAAFCPKCCGEQVDRDLAYHQGTVWSFPLGAYLRAMLRWDPAEACLETVKEKLSMFETGLREGCVGQVAEIYDGENPVESRGCYAQAWGTGEMLAVYREVERRER